MKPYFEEAGIQIFHGDCCELMPALGPVDLVLTDPPYGMDYQSARRTDKSRWKPKIANDSKPFIWWLHGAWMLSAMPSALACFCDWKRQEVFRSAIEVAGYDVRSQAIWDRGSHGMGDLNGSFAPQHDVIWFAAKGDFAFPGDRPASVLRHFRIGGEQLVHPNEKPTALMRSLVRSLSAPTAYILDPFMGSGTTLVAAKQLGRHAIGIEIEEKYCEIAVKRLAQAVLDFEESRPKQELRQLSMLRDSGHPDQDGIERAMGDWIMEDAIEESEK